MKKIVLLLTILFCSAVAASAQNPHFQGAPKVTLNNDGSVDVCFREAGLGNTISVNYLLTADVEVTWRCQNRGGQCPNAENKKTVATSVAIPGSFSSGRNGQIRACITIEPPALSPGELECPGSQVVALAEVKYTNIVLKDLTNGITADTSTSSVSAAYACK